MPGREEMLERIRQALGRSQGAPSPSIEFPPLGAVMPLIRPEELVPRFETEFRQVAGTPHQAADREELNRLFRLLLRGSASVVLSRNPLLSQLGVEETLRAWGLEITVWPRLGPSATDGSGDFRQRCFQAQFGITGADLVLAETGSLVLSSITEGSQLASLAPPVHIVLYRRSQVVGSLEEVLEQAPLARLEDPGRSVVLITGTSRTADIEQILVRGVHGPREVHAILVEESCLRQ